MFPVTKHPELVTALIHTFDFKYNFSFTFNLFCYMHNNYSQAVIGNEILNSQALSNNVYKKIMQLKKRI